MTCRYGVYRVNLQPVTAAHWDEEIDNLLGVTLWVPNPWIVTSWPRQLSHFCNVKFFKIWIRMAILNCSMILNGTTAIHQIGKIVSKCGCLGRYTSLPNRSRYNECLSKLIPKTSLKSLIEVAPEIRECMVLEDQFHWGMRFEKANMTTSDSGRDHFWSTM